MYTYIYPICICLYNLSLFPTLSVSPHTHPRPLLPLSLSLSLSLYRHTDKCADSISMVSASIYMVVRARERFSSSSASPCVVMGHPRSTSSCSLAPARSARKEASVTPRQLLTSSIRNDVHVPRMCEILMSLIWQSAISSAERWEKRGIAAITPWSVIKGQLDSASDSNCSANVAKWRTPVAVCCIVLQ